jgi:hypothetical protein
MIFRLKSLRQVKQRGHLPVSSRYPRLTAPSRYYRVICPAIAEQDDTQGDVALTIACGGMAIGTAWRLHRSK